MEDKRTKTVVANVVFIMAALDSFWIKNSIQEVLNQ